jgi:hypothetical protein
MLDARKESMPTMTAALHLPVIDVTPLREGSDATIVAAEIGAACRDTGFSTSPDMASRPSC